MTPRKRTRVHGVEPIDRAPGLPPMCQDFGGLHYESVLITDHPLHMYEDVLVIKQDTYTGRWSCYLERFRPGGGK